MKKLMIAAAAVCAAAMSYGAAANWSAGADEIYNGTGSSAESGYYNGTAYVFDAAQMGQSALFDIFKAGGTIGSATTGYMASGEVEDGSFSGADFSNGEQGASDAFSYYFALVEKDKIYFSNILSVKAAASSASKPVAFGDQYDGEYGADSVAKPEGIDYAGEGAWSSVASVPEPFSGSLALLGMGVLALRRKMKKAKKA